jgi:predicted nucleic acid-binding protein
MATFKAEELRIPRRAREALAHHEEVVVFNRERPAYVIVHPDDHRRTAVSRRGRSLGEALALLAQAAPPDAAIAAITASELLHGVHRATDEHRGQRETFVEAVLGAFPTLPFDLLVARVHARLWAGLASSGTEVGAHDRLVAASAMSAGWRVGTANIRHFDRIPGLETMPVQLA